MILSGGVPRKFIWVDIGSKLAKMANVLINMTTPKPNDFFIMAKVPSDNKAPGDLPEIIKAATQACDEFMNTLRRY